LIWQEQIKQQSFTLNKYNTKTAKDNWKVTLTLSSYSSFLSLFFIIIYFLVGLEQGRVWQSMKRAEGQMEARF